MRDLGLQPDIVLVSSARRTLETLEALEPWDETPLIETMDTLYMAPSQHLLKLLQEVAETVRSVLLLGHNPGMHELALLLAGGMEAARTAAEPTRRLAEGFPAEEKARGGPLSGRRRASPRRTVRVLIAGRLAKRRSWALRISRRATPTRAG